jgi:hypothetical protein
LATLGRSPITNKETASDVPIQAVFCYSKGSFMDVNDTESHWHLDKRLNVGHVLTTLSIAGVMILWAMNIEGRIQSHDIQLTTIVEQMDRMDDRNIRSLENISEQINRINDKLDRLIERQ